MRLDIITPKAYIVIMLVLIAILEIKNGSFREIPARLRGKNTGFYLSLLAAAVLLPLLFIFLDIRLVNWLKALPFPGKAPIIEFGGFIGKSYRPWMILAALYLLFYVIRQKTLRQILLGCILGSGLTAALSHLLKHIFLRPRPYGGLGPYLFFQWKDFLDNSRLYQSYPSGDVAVVAGAAGYLFFAAKNRILGTLLMILPVLTAMSRITLDRHWPTDTLCSILLGIVVGKFLWDCQASSAR